VFKEGHVQNIMVHQQGSVFQIDCRCLPEMKKDRVYEIKVEIFLETSSDHLAEGLTNSFKHTKHTELKNNIWLCYLLCIAFNYINQPLFPLVLMPLLCIHSFNSTTLAVPYPKYNEI